jgi:hypothetical protein
MEHLVLQELLVLLVLKVLKEQMALQELLVHRAFLV